MTTNTTSWLQEQPLLGFAGEYHEPGTGLIYLRARHYDPFTGQFLTRDPIEVLTRSAYGHVNNNPLNAIDPSGLMPGGGILGSIGDFFTGGGCGDGGLFGDITDAVGGFGDFLGDVGSLAWQYRDEIAFVAILAGSAGSGGLFAVAFYGGFTLATASTATACARGQRASCAVGVISLVTGGAGRGLQNAGAAMTRAGNARTAASGIHVIRRTVTGPLLETVGGGASRTGAVSGRIGDGFGFAGLFL